MTRAHSQTASVINALPIAALFIDESAQIIAYNAMAETVLGSGLLGRHYMMCLRQPTVLRAIEDCFETHTETRAQYVGQDGAKDATYDLRCAYVAGEGAGVLITLSDVSEAQENDHMRREFVANVSHELRTPLTAVMGFIETLQGRARDDPQASERFLNIMADETARMNRLVDDLLSLTQVEREERRRPNTQLNIAGLLVSLTQVMTGLAADTGAMIELEHARSDVTIAGDADRLRQVFSNLIENALKYGGDGVSIFVTLHAPAFEPRLRAKAVRICVRDTGPGFDPVHSPRLTERFYRIDSHRSRNMGGTGLGLAIVKHIVARHRGRLEIKSGVGQGSEFTVILPIEPA